MQVSNTQVEAAILSREGILSRFKLGADSESKSGRKALSREVVTSLVDQFPSLAGQDLSGYTCEQERSKQNGAQYDIHVYDATGTLRYEGRKFDRSQGVSFWKPGSA